MKWGEWEEGGRREVGRRKAGKMKSGKDVMYEKDLTFMSELLIPKEGTQTEPGALIKDVEEELK